MKKNSLILILFASCIFNLQNSLNGQNLKKRDSLEKRVKNAISDTDKANSMVLLSSELAQYDIKKSKSYAETAIKIARKNNNPKIEAEALLVLARIDRAQNNYIVSLNKIISALRKFEQVNDTTGQAKSYFELGYIYKDIDNYQKAINNFTKSLSLYKKTGDEAKVAMCQMVMGHVNADRAWILKDTSYSQKTHTLYTKALSYYKKNKDEERISVSLLNLANLYLGYNRIHPSNTFLEKSLFYSNESLKLSLKNNDNLRSAINIGNIAEANYAQKKYKEALQNYFKANKMLKETGNIDFTLGTLYSVINVYKDLKMYDKALEYSKEHLKIAKANNYIGQIKDNYFTVSEIYSAQKKFSEAYENRLLYEKYLDSILDEQKAKALIKSQIEFESYNKDKEILLLSKNQELQGNKLKQEEQTRNFLIAIILSVLLLLLLIYSRFIIKAKANTIIEEKNKQLEKLSIVARETANGVFITDANGKIEWFNEGFSKLFGWETIEEYIEKRGDNIFKVSGNNDITNLIKKAIDEKTSVTYENPTPTKDKNQLWIQTTLTPIFNKSEQLTKLVFVETDISKLKNSEEQYQEVNKELEAFSYSVSHDLRSPLRAINGYSKILQEDYSSDIGPDGTKALGAILNNSKKMGELIDDLLTFSRLGRAALTTTEINMAALVNTTIEEETNGNQQNIRFTLNELLPSVGTPSLIKQVWVNLISNAIKFSTIKSNPHIEIGSYPDKEDFVVYYVKDNGAGFDIQYYNKLFGVFQRLHSQNEFEGTGIGLAIVHKIIQRHNGTVWAESTLNEGSCFYFSLPKNNI
ncbi:ATP-binding protein [Flavobacterium amniphilum]|uniref:ATP-binding protein n=1 Tax=Flavobacterium amniphilum TaxID=1834035 RepID=UPI00202A1F69|nr:ATP-binding protein [Flavobacterium amniphilum]MCL9806532.1 ATP-binding protein [Flavobacterium amniphilum]